MHRKEQHIIIVVLFFFLLLSLMLSLSKVSIEDEIEKLSKAARTIHEALPYSRYGSQADHFGYKRCASAATAFKGLVKSQLDKLVSGAQWNVVLQYVLACRCDSTMRPTISTASSAARFVVDDSYIFIVYLFICLFFYC